MFTVLGSNASCLHKIIGEHLTSLSTTEFHVELNVLLAVSLWNLLAISWGNFFSTPNYFPHSKTKHVNPLPYSCFWEKGNKISHFPKCLIIGSCFAPCQWFSWLHESEGKGICTLTFSQHLHTSLHTCHNKSWNHNVKF